MSLNNIDESQRKALRTAGLLYFLMAIIAPIGLMYVPGTLIVTGDATATADNIRASGWLLRIGIGSELFHQTIAVFLVLALYRLFKPVSEQHARLMVVLGALVSVPIMFLNVLNEIAALMLVSGANFLSVFDKSQLDAMALLFLRLHDQGMNVASIFWGLWLFPFGILVIRSGFIPRVLGIFLFIAGSAYLASSVTSILLPQYAQLVGQVTMVLMFGELPIIFWLLIKGLRPSRLMVILGLFAVTAYGQEIQHDFDGHTWEAPYKLPVPKGWTVERFPVPISFAPQIPYKGVEDIRFTPGWAKAKSDEYWSYAFLWYLEGEVKIDSRILDSNLTAYYTGLIASNGPNIARDKLIPVVTSFKEVKKHKGDARTYVGTIRMLDYMAQKPIVLNCKAHLKTCPGENKTFIFYELSPQPLSHNIWLGLDKLWLDFRCKTN